MQRMTTWQWEAVATEIGTGQPLGSFWRASQMVTASLRETRPRLKVRPLTSARRWDVLLKLCPIMLSQEYSIIQPLAWVNSGVQGRGRGVLQKRDGWITVVVILHCELECCGVTWEIHFWPHLWGFFQRGFTEEGSLTLNVACTVPVEFCTGYEAEGRLQINFHLTLVSWVWVPCD